MYKIVEELYYVLSGNLLMIKLISLLYPLLSWHGIAWDRPLIISVPDECTFREVVAVLKGYGLPPVKSLASSPKEVEKVLKSAEYNLCIFRYCKSRYLSENLQKITDKMQEISDVDVLSTLSLVFVIGPVPSELFDYAAGCIYMGNGIDTVAPNYSGSWVESFLKFVLQLKYDHAVKLVKKSSMTHSQEYAVLDLIVRIWEGYLDHSGVEKREVLSQVTALRANMNDIVAHWTKSGNTDVYVEAFADVLIRYAEKYIKYPCFHRRRVDGSLEDRIDEIVLYDDRAYYLPSSMFNEVVKMMEKYSEGLDVKGELARAGVLHTEGHGRNYFTVKTEMLMTDAAVITKRRVKLDRKKLDIDGEMTLCEVLAAKGEV